jgi:4a-hydroxytetrahydrobiopterin dehydratase
MLAFQRTLYFLKQTLLAISIVYFYWLSFAINFGNKTYGLDEPQVFVIMGIIFLSALAIEAAVTWWHKRKRIIWWAMLAISYAMLGFVIAPQLYGDNAIIVALLLPLVVVFIGGFAYSFSKLIYRAFTVSMKLPIDDVMNALKNLPGWNYLAGGLEKTYSFGGFDEALKFLNTCGVIADKNKHVPDFDIHEKTVKVRLSTHDVQGVTEKDLQLAKEFDSV